jgi:hypothetical protein
MKISLGREFCCVNQKGLEPLWDFFELIPVSFPQYSFHVLLGIHPLSRIQAMSALLTHACHHSLAKKLTEVVFCVG